MADANRRRLLFGTIALGGAAWAWQLFGVREPRLAFAPIEGLPGWRRVETGPVSSGVGPAASAVFLGIGETGPTLDPLPPERLCDVLFQGSNRDAVLLAVFTDAFCPYCRVLASRLGARRNDVAWHELPLLGPSSDMAAKASAAAGLQDGYLAFQENLLANPFRPSPLFIDQIARRAGLDPVRLLADMESPTIAEQLAESRAAAMTLGIYGTPAIVVGRTLAMGNIEIETLDRLIGLERERGPGC